MASGYTVFRKNPVTNEWAIIGESSAATQGAAVKEVVGDPAAGEGLVFAAVPTRSWHPLTFKPRTVNVSHVLTTVEPELQGESAEGELVGSAA